MKSYYSVMARKMIPVISLISLCFFTSVSSSVFAQKTNAGNNPRLFLYASDLPQTLNNQYYILRKHVVDVVLATQLYDLVFSRIPEYLAQSKNPQYILKYKLRTDGPKSYRIELFMINADEVQILRSTKQDKIHIDNLLFEFRLSLYEFILQRKLSPTDYTKFREHSFKKIGEIKKEKLEKRPPPGPEKYLGQKQIIKPTIPKKALSFNELKQMKKDPSKIHSVKTLKTAQVNPKEKASLWKLLIDEDKDMPWEVLKQKIAEEKSDADNKKKENIFRRQNPSVTNPFRLGANLSLMTDDEKSKGLGYHQFHFGWKYVQRRLVIKDLVRLENEFFSLFGLTAEWIYYNPLHISRFLLRNGVELDKAIKTRPINMKGHVIFRTGFGYKVNNWLLPSLYYEQSDLHYANLNEYGKGITANYHSIQWINLELAILGNQTYISGHFAKSIGSSLNQDPREKKGPSGYRFGWNLRYFFNNKLMGMRIWGDVEYRHESFTRENTNNELTLRKSEYSARLGVHF